MTTKYWVGAAVAVAQVWTGSIDSVDGTPANNTFTVTIGGVAVSVAGNTSVSQTATDLRAALNASTHPYFAAITWSGSSGNIIGTADTAGCPFVAALTKTGAGSGSVTDFAATTANAGPNDWSTAANWSDGVVPASTDTVIVPADAASYISWGLAQSGVTLTALYVRKPDHRIGLRSNAFATSADGQTVDSAYPEYRQSYLDVGADIIELGDPAAFSTPTGSGRIKIDNAKSGASVFTIHETAPSAVESGLPSVLYIAAHANADVYVRAASGGIGIAVMPTETATVGIVSVDSETRTTRVLISSGVTLTTYTQRGGDNVLGAAATIATVNVLGGTLTTEGDYTATAVNVLGGTLFANHKKTAGNAITTATIDGGTLDGSQSLTPRTWATVNLTSGTVRADGDYVTITTLGVPASPYTVQLA